MRKVALLGLSWDMSRLLCQWIRAVIIQAFGAFLAEPHQQDNKPNQWNEDDKKPPAGTIFVM